MKISLITPTYNSAKTIRDTIESIVSQHYPDLEYLVIDGASSDETLAIVSEYKNKLNTKIISEKDKGIYDAMNKGVRIATGEIVGILNSDDFYYDNSILTKVAKIFQSNPDIDAVYGDLVYVDKENINKKKRFWKAGTYEEQKLNWGWSIPHPTLFLRQRVYKKSTNIFDTSFSLAADYEFVLRQLKINKIKVSYLPETLVTMRDGGASASSLKQRITGWKELRKSWEINKLKVPPFFISRRLLNKLSQYIRRKP